MVDSYTFYQVTRLILAKTANSSSQNLFPAMIDVWALRFNF